MTATVPAPSARTSAATSDWRTGDWFIARIAGLALSTVEGLRCPRAADWAEEVLALRDRLAADGARVGDLLHDLIKGNEDEEARRRLLGPAPAGAQQRAARRPGRLSPWSSASAPGRRRTCGGGWPAGSGWPGWNTTAPPCSPPTSPGPAGDCGSWPTSPGCAEGSQLASPTLDSAVSPRGSRRIRPARGTSAPRSRRALTAVLPLSHRLQDQPVQHLHRLSRSAGSDDDAEGPGLKVGERWQRHVRLNVVLVGRIAELISRRPGAARRPAGGAEPGLAAVTPSGSATCGTG